MQRDQAIHTGLTYILSIYHGTSDGDDETKLAHTEENKTEG
uniref:Uncharacterized protein n=1 Tax=Arundo donax TaxID=35708 RepID=A0A0A9HKL8_ARUDO